MSDIHVLDAGEGGDAWRVVMHIPIPNVNNAIGVNYRTALTRSGIGGTTVLPDGDGTDGTISAAEKADIQNGILFEHIVPFIVESGGANFAQLQRTIRALYTQEKDAKLTLLQKRLRYYGHTESET